jgi:hypothetical protein
MRSRLSVISASAVALTAVGMIVLAPHTAAAAAASIDPATAVRGSLGVSLEDLGIKSTIGELSLYLNGGLALLSGALAALLVRANRRKNSGAKQAVPGPGGRVRATMGETWMKLARRMPIGH